MNLSHKFQDGELQKGRNTMSGIAFTHHLAHPSREIFVTTFIMVPCLVISKLWYLASKKLALTCFKSDS